MSTQNNGQNDEIEEPITVRYNSNSSKTWHGSLSKVFSRFFEMIVILAVIYFFLAICAGEWYPGAPFMKR